MLSFFSNTLRPVCPGYFPNPIQYTGYHSDGDIFEHYYAKARYYDPYTGRFLSRDPADFDPESFPGAVNRYTYAANNPLRYVDPDGRFFFLPLLLAGVEFFSSMPVLFAIGADMIIAGGFEYASNKEDGLGGVLLAMSQQLISDVLLYAYAATLSARYATGTNNHLFGSTLGAIDDSFTKANKFLEITGVYLSWAQQTTLNIGGAAGKWGQNWLPHGVHHGWSGYIGGFLGLSFPPGIGAWAAGNTLIATAGCIIALDDFAQHLTQIIYNDPNRHSILHKLYVE